MQAIMNVLMLFAAPNLVGVVRAPGFHTYYLKWFRSLLRLPLSFFDGDVIHLRVTVYLLTMLRLEFSR